MALVKGQLGTRAAEADDPGEGNGREGGDGKRGLHADHRDALGAPGNDSMSIVDIGKEGTRCVRDFGSSLVG